MQPDGWRVLQPLPNFDQWCRCFDLLQMNEDEVTTVARDPMELAATAMAAGVRCLAVTLGSTRRRVLRGAGLRFASPISRSPAAAIGDVGPLRTALVPVPTMFDSGDPTGCGDVWGATYFSRLLAGDDIASAMRAAHAAAARNVNFAAPPGSPVTLRGELITQ